MIFAKYPTKLFEMIEYGRLRCGAVRDLELIDKLQSTYSPLSKFLDEHEMVSAEGFKRGNRKKVCNDFWDMPCIEAKIFVPYYSPEDNESRVDYTDFECIVLKNERYLRPSSSN